MVLLIQKIDQEVKKEVDEAVKKAKSDPEPPVSDLTAHILLRSS